MGGHRPGLRPAATGAFTIRETEHHAPMRLSLRRVLLAATASLALVGAALPAHAIPEEDVEGATPKQDTKSGIEQWECGDYFDFDGCRFPATNCIMLTANLHDGTGEVKFDEIVQTTRFEIQGIERRWDWCLNAEAAYECAFVISFDRTGSYYNFRGTDGTVEPRDRFKCAKH